MLQPFPAKISSSFPNDLATLLDTQRRTINDLALHAEATYKTILKPLQDLDEELDAFFTPLAHLNSVSNTVETQTAYEKSIPLLSAFHSELTQHTALHKKIQLISSGNSESQTVIEHTLQDFRLAGALLSDVDKQRMKAVDLRLSELGNMFSQNLLDATNAWEMILEDPADVAELPPSDLAAATLEQDGKTFYRFTLQIPSYLAYMTYGSNRSRREELSRAYHTRAPENATIIDELLRLREEKAHLLGFDNYAHYALEARDAGSERDVLNFLNTLAEAALPQAQEELKILQDFAREEDGVELAVHDVAYYSEKLKKITFNYDESEAKPYFEQKRVLEGMLSFVTDLFGVTFEPIDVPTWHTSVYTYDLYEAGNHTGRIYFDLEAREGKRGGAWMHDWETHYIDTKGAAHLASAFVVANFAPASPKTPSLLRHDDVVTLFHEMGHAIHHLFSRTRERSISGIHGVAWDVVEFPSQFLENFAYEKAILQRFGFHHESGDPIPDRLIVQIKAAKNFQAALGILRQVELSLFDFQLHQKRYQGEAIQELLDGIRKKTSLLPPPSHNRFQHGFSHIFAGGYAAGYYSYKWAEVLSADAFFACVDMTKGLNPEKAHGYKTHILAQGSSQSMSQLFKNWLGHSPKSEYLLYLYGIDSA